MHPIEQRRPRQAELRAKSEHLNRLPDIHGLLRVLNDPYASLDVLATHVVRVDVLVARCVHRAITQSGGRELHSLEQVLTLIGNRGLESELFALLEDLTVLKANLDEDRALGTPGVPPGRR